MNDKDSKVFYVGITLKRQRICTEYSVTVIPIYEEVFKKMDFWMPFVELKKELFKYLELTPSQLHPNCMACLENLNLTRISKHYS